MKIEGDMTANSFGPVLIGMRGAGKSTIGPIAARTLGMAHADSDALVEQRMGQDTASIFRTLGEARFRAAERDVMLELLGKAGTVVSAGGGSILDPDVRALMKRRMTVWLTAPVPVLAARIKGSQRPSLTGAPATDELEGVLKARERLYLEAAAATIDTSLCGPEEAAGKIAELWKSNAGRGGC
jgi:shikimate kinase